MNDLPEAAQAILLAVLKRPANARAGYLEAACGTDSELHSRIQRWLEAYDPQTRGLEPTSAADAAMVGTGLQADADAPGTAKIDRDGAEQLAETTLLPITRGHRMSMLVGTRRPTIWRFSGDHTR